MKAKIDKDGFLYIERAGVMKPQMCPNQQIKVGATFGQFIEWKCCGDWCPLFGELSVFSTNTETGVKSGAIELCKRELEFTDLTDERKGE